MFTNHRDTLGGAEHSSRISPAVLHAQARELRKGNEEQKAPKTWFLRRFSTKRGRASKGAGGGAQMPAAFRLKACILTFLLCAVSAIASAEASAVKLEWAEKAFGDGRHNAFTDLTFWHGAFYLCFRNGTSHGSMDGLIKIMRSADARTWEPCGELDTLGDDRDPHFAATEDALHVFFGVWDLKHGEDHATPDRSSIRSHVASSKDGLAWSSIQGIYEPGWWLWRVIQHQGAFYAAAYTAYRPKPAQRELRLLSSPDGLEWNLVSTIAKDRMPTESDLWFDGQGTLNAVTRMADETNEACWFKSDASLKEWRPQFLGDIIHSPAVAQWHDRIFIAGRGKSDRGWVTRVWGLSSDRAVSLLTLPSTDDTAYPGLIVDPATAADALQPALLVSWYSQHEPKNEPMPSKNAANVYVGRIVFPDATAK